MNPVKIIKGYIDILGRLGQIYRQNGGLINVIKISYRYLYINCIIPVNKLQI